uniref:Uncharacterized protein n=1 Tax=Astyanax mexicanus TaxID=7994 RepID=A0A8B9HFV2_ASTMX
MAEIYLNTSHFQTTTPISVDLLLKSVAILNVKIDPKRMAYRKVCASRGSAAISQDLESEGLQMASLDMEWEMEKELEEPGGLDHFQLEHRPMETSSSGAMDPDLEPIQPSASPHGRFQRLQEDPNYTSHFSRTMPKSQRRSGACIAKYLLAGAGVFFLGLLIGLYTHRAEKQPEISNQSTDLLERVVQSITAEKIQALQREFQATTSEEDRVKGLAQKWEELGLKNVQLSSYNVLLSHPGPRPNTIVDMTTKHCYLPSGHSCDTWGNPSYSTEQLFAMATYSAVGTLEAEVVDVQYGSSEDLRRIRAEMNVTNKIAVLKLGQAPLLYTLSRLAEMGFGGSLLYVEPCDVITEQKIWWKAFGVTLNPGGDPSTPDYPSTGENLQYLKKNHNTVQVEDFCRILRGSVGVIIGTKPVQCPKNIHCIVKSIGTHASYFSYPVFVTVTVSIVQKRKTVFFSFTFIA